jgi:starch-binding outer membrane protein, SusD/RagB family
MSTLKRNSKGRGRRLLPASGMIAAFAVITALGCDVDDILQVDDPETATIEDIENPDNLPAVRAHAIGEFQVAYAGRGAAQDNSFILFSGLLTDEYEASGTFPTRVEVDRRNIRVDNATTQETFRLMHRARVAADRSVQAHAMHDPGTRPHAEAYVLEGFMYNAFGEMYCSGVPFSELPPGGDPEFGEPLPTEQIFQEALNRFDQGASLAAQADAQMEVYAAAIGTGRALLNLGLYEQAAEAVADVPTEFVYNVNHSDATPRQWNGQWNFVNSVKRWRIPNEAGGNGLPYRDDGTEADAAGNIIEEGDPRIVWFEDGSGFDSEVIQYSQLKYPSNDSPTPIATGIEARLIEAEAALNNGGDFASIHNDLRGTIGLGAVDVGGDPVAAHFKERAYWLWQTGHRLGDLRRMIRQYDYDSEEIFPSGTYHKGGPIGTDVNFPIPIDEENNPNFQACLNRDA